MDAGLPCCYARGHCQLSDNSNWTQESTGASSSTPQQFRDGMLEPSGFAGSFLEPSLSLMCHQLVARQTAAAVV